MKGKNKLLLFKKSRVSIATFDATAHLKGVPAKKKIMCFFTFLSLEKKTGVMAPLAAQRHKESLVKNESNKM